MYGDTVNLSVKLYLQLTSYFFPTSNVAAPLRKGSWRAAPEGSSVDFRRISLCTHAISTLSEETKDTHGKIRWYLSLDPTTASRSPFSPQGTKGRGDGGREDVKNKT